MRNQLMAEYLRDPKASLFEDMLKQGTSTAPVQHWTQGLARMLQGGLGGYMAGKLRGEYEDKSKAATEERKKAMELASAGDIKGGMAALQSPYNEDFQGTMFGAKLNQDTLNAQQQFNAQQQERLFAQQKALAEMTAARQEAANNALLQRQIDLAKWKDENDPQKAFLKSIFSGAGQQQPQPQMPPQNMTPVPNMTPIPGQAPTLGQAGIVPQPTNQPAPQINAQSALFNSMLASQGIKAPEGFMYVPKQGGGIDLVPFTNPKDQATLEKAQRENEQAVRAKQETEAGMINTILAGRNLVKDPNREAGTGVSSIFSSLPGTAARDFNAKLEAFKAKNFLPAVQQLRGLGALSENEGKKLVDAIGALDSGMSESAFLASLNQINSDLEAAAKRTGLQIPPTGTEIKFLGFE